MIAKSIAVGGKDMKIIHPFLIYLLGHEKSVNYYAQPQRAFSMAK